VHAVVATAVAFLVGAIPFSQIAARWRAGVDLRRVGSGTVSGTSLFRVAGFGPLAVAGVCDVAKGAAGVAVAGSRPALAALCGGLAVAGHNWSPFLRGAGGRGISPAIGALLAQAWPGAVVLLAGLVLGRLVHETGLGSFLADAAVVPVTTLTHGPAGAFAGLCVVVPMLVKRALGNARPPDPSARAYLHRLLYDQDPALP
jgi:acyl phosphate:glycerol-3-phosphate acyltransferase